MDEFTLGTRHGAMTLIRTGQGEPVLLLHGIPGSSATWHASAELLAGSARVLVPDLLGFGRSSRPRDLGTLHARGQAEALADALDGLDVETVTVVGHDFGGPVALILAGLLPGRVRGLGLLASNVFPDTPAPFPLSLLHLPVLGRHLGPVLFSRPSLATMLAIGAGRPRPRIDRASHLGDAEQVRAIRTIFEGSLRHLADLYAPVEDQLTAWSGPAFVAWGDRDPFFPVAHGERTAAAAGTTLTLLRGAGHFLPQERPAEVAAAITTLLDVARAR